MSPLRVLVVDDSAANRLRLTQGIEASGVGQVVGSAADGSEALRMVAQLSPDAITLDLEMPRMDGFSFLRLLMSSRPTPVIVVSSYSQKENVFRALELGALDFVARSTEQVEGEVVDVLVQKLSLVRSVRHNRVSYAPVVLDRASVRSDNVPLKARHIVAIAASTGGPTALTDILSKLSAKHEYAVLVAQHMPAKFTTTFAQRLNRYSALEVAEASDGDVVRAGTAFICPGNKCMELVVLSDGEPRIRLRPPILEERYLPSANRLLSSVAMAYGPRAIGVILTGMGDDGAIGAKLIAEKRGRLLVESEATSIVYGMPRAALRAVESAVSVDLGEISGAIMKLVGGSSQSRRL